MQERIAWSRADHFIIDKYRRPLVHLRNQRKRQRLGIILGSGIMRPLRFPDWDNLVHRIAEDIDVNGLDIIKSPLGQNDNKPSQSQLLFEHFKRTNYSATNENISTTDSLVMAHWQKIVHRNLYCNTIKDTNIILRRHPYFSELLNIIQKARITINYNFDDTIEHVLNKQKKIYETVWDTHKQYGIDRAVIYHPNGYLPRNLLDNPSEHIVFSEYEFADQLINSMSGHHTLILDYLFMNTCLIIGISLNDSTLKHLLRQSAMMNPGHYHYYIQYIPNMRKPDSEKRKAIKNTNFNLYNLITLFLDKNGVKSLLKLVTLEPDSLLHYKSNELGLNTVYTYYFSGVMGIGKSSCLDYLRSLITFDEWFSERLPELRINYKSLGSKMSSPKLQKVDSWIADQFYEKNKRASETQEGIQVLDRCPLDPIAFTNENEYKLKATMLLNTILPGEADWGIVPGHIIFLVGNPHEIRNRLIRRHKKEESEEKYIDEIQNKLKTIYKCDVVTVLDIRGLNIIEIVKSVSKIIHLGDYKLRKIESNLNQILSNQYF